MFWKLVEQCFYVIFHFSRSVKHAETSIQLLMCRVIQESTLSASTTFLFTYSEFLQYNMS